MVNAKLKLSVFIVIGLYLLSCSKQVVYDIVLDNGEVFMNESGNFEKRNVGIIDGKIQKVSQQQLVGKHTIDASNQFIYPGFIDAHAHFVEYAYGLDNVLLFGTKSFDEVLQRVIDFSHQNPDLNYIVGRGWDQNDWSDKQFPTNDSLNKLFPKIPVVLIRIDGHAALVNNAAMDLAGELPNHVDGGEIVRLNNEPTGLLVDLAIELIPNPNIEATKRVSAFEIAQANCFAVGITSLVDAGLDKETILFIDSIQKFGLLKMPINAMIRNHEEDYEWFFEKGKIKTELLQVNSIKVYGDGALGSRGALLLQPYSDDDLNQGLMLTSQSSLRELCKKALANNFQVNVHAIGDSANRLVVQTFAEVLNKGNDRRWRVEHAQIVHPSDSSYWMDFNIIPSIQPTHATSDMYWVEERLGPDRTTYSYPYKSLLKWSKTLALGTDFPVEYIDPRKTLYAAVTRQDANQYPEGGFIPSERLTRLEALNGMTLWAAYAQFQENETGSISEGKWADLIISSTDLMNCEATEIVKAPINFTLVHGEIVHERSNR